MSSAYSFAFSRLQHRHKRSTKADKASSISSYQYLRHDFKAALPFPAGCQTAIIDATDPTTKKLVPTHVVSIISQCVTTHASGRLILGNTIPRQLYKNGPAEIDGTRKDRIRCCEHAGKQDDSYEISLTSFEAFQLATTTPYASLTVIYAQHLHRTAGYAVCALCKPTDANNLHVHERITSLKAYDLLLRLSARSRQCVITAPASKGKESAKDPPSSASKKRQRSGQQQAGQSGDPAYSFSPEDLQRLVNEAVEGRHQGRGEVEVWLCPCPLCPGRRSAVSVLIRDVGYNKHHPTPICHQCWQVFPKTRAGTKDWVAHRKLLKDKEHPELHCVKKCVCRKEHPTVERAVAAPHDREPNGGCWEEDDLGCYLFLCQAMDPEWYKPKRFDRECNHIAQAYRARGPATANNQQIPTANPPAQDVQRLEGLSIEEWRAQSEARGQRIIELENQRRTLLESLRINEIERRDEELLNLRSQMSRLEFRIRCLESTRERLIATRQHLVTLLCRQIDETFGSRPNLSSLSSGVAPQSQPSVQNATVPQTLSDPTETDSAFMCTDPASIQEDFWSLPSTCTTDTQAMEDVLGNPGMMPEQDGSQLNYNDWVDDNDYNAGLPSGGVPSGSGTNQPGEVHDFDGLGGWTL